MSEAAAHQLVSLAQLYRAAFSTDVGQKVLADLRACYGGSTVGQDARETEIHSAQRDVLLRIEELHRIAGIEPGMAAEELARRPDEVEILMNPWVKYAR